jgi:prolyl oligopeptidase
MKPSRGLMTLLLGAAASAGCAAAPVAKPPPPSPTASAAPSASTAPPKVGLAYPLSPQGAVVEKLHGVDVRDPYRWLEDSASAETRTWIEAQNQLTQSYLAAIPSRSKIRSRLRELWDYERYALPTERGGRYFYSYNSGLMNQAALYWLPSLTGKAKLLLDPNPLAADGTVALRHIVPSEDGKLVAYGLSHAGSDWNEWHVRKVDDGQDLPDLVKWSKFSTVSWTRDGRGFYYSRFAEPKPGAALEESNYFNKLYFHRLGDDQAKDVLIYERPDKKRWSFHPNVTRDGRYLIVTIAEGTDDKYGVLYFDLRRPKAPPVELFGGLDAEYLFIGNRGTKFWFKTDKQAPRGRIAVLDIADAKPELRELVAEQPETLQQVEQVGGKLVANYLKDARADVRVFSEDGVLEQTVPLPGVGTVWFAEGDRARSETFFSFQSFSEPHRLLRYDVKSKTSEVFRKSALKFNPDDYETRQVFFPSKDGTRIPMFLTFKKGVQPTPDTPCLLYGYGGFSIAVTPSFRVSFLSWLELGGVLAVPNLRGGGEYGETWHDAGKKGNKQNVFDDFIAAAEYLTRERVTSKQKLAIFGRSNGGLLVGAMLAQRPELFGAALPAVGVMDMLRFHKFTIGWTWTDDYGSPDHPADFKALYAYSPLHNLRARSDYPPTLITTADHDDRVVPAHSYKFTAALQKAQTGQAPVLIRIETRAGHGAGIPTEKLIDEVADQWSFLTRALVMSP